MIKIKGFKCPGCTSKIDSVYVELGGLIKQKGSLYLLQTCSGDHDEDVRIIVDNYSGNGECPECGGFHNLSDMIILNEVTTTPMFQVIDRVTGVYCGKPLKTRKSASRKADRLDLDYGAIRYGVLEVTQLTLGGF